MRALRLHHIGERVLGVRLEAEDEGLPAST